MPREASITYDQVAAIADTIKATGGKPNPRQIRERHGSGSLGTIHKLYQQWEAGQSRQIEASLALPPSLQRAILEFMDQELTTARVEIEAKLSDAQLSANDLAAENERQVNQIEILENTLEGLQGEKATLAGRVVQLDADLVDAREEAVRERQAAEAARTELAKAQLRLEALPRIEAEADRLLAELNAERKARTEAEQNAAVLGSKVEYETELRKKAEAGMVEYLRDAEEAGKRAVASAEALGNERVAVQAAQARLEAAARELADIRKAMATAQEAAKRSGEEAAELRGQLAEVRKTADPE